MEGKLTINENQVEELVKGFLSRKFMQGVYVTHISPKSYSSAVEVSFSDVAPEIETEEMEE